MVTRGKRQGLAIIIGTITLFYSSTNSLTQIVMLQSNSCQTIVKLQIKKLAQNQKEL